MQLLVIDIPVIAVSLICTVQPRHDDPYVFSFAPLCEFASVFGFVFLVGWIACNWYHRRNRE